MKKKLTEDDLNELDLVLDETDIESMDEEINDYQWWEDNEPGPWSPIEFLD